MFKVYEKNIYDMIIKCNDSIENTLEEYLKLLSSEKGNLLFMYKGVNLLENKNIIKKINKFKKKNIIISIINKNKSQSLKEIENFICPECKNVAFININEDNISVNCMNKHKSEYSINEFIESQKIEENEIKCNICKNNKNLYKDNFYICTCNKYICQLCLSTHI